MPLTATYPCILDVNPPEVREIALPATIGDVPEPAEPLAPLLDAEVGNAEVFRVALEDGGKIALPEVIRDHLGIAEGDVVLIKTQRDGSALVLSLKRVIDHARGAFKHLAPDRRVSDELIAERREEARRESEE